MSDKQRRPCSALRCPNYAERGFSYCSHHLDKWRHREEQECDPDNPLAPTEHEGDVA